MRKWSELPIKTVSNLISLMNFALSLPCRALSCTWKKVLGSLFAYSCKIKATQVFLCSLDNINLICCLTTKSLDVDRNVWTAYCKSSSGDGVDWFQHSIMYHGGLL